MESKAIIDTDDVIPFIDDIDDLLNILVLHVKVDFS